MAKETIGFIGVGRMGARMVRRLIDAGYGLTIYDTSAEALAPLVALGATRVDSPAAVASAAEIVFASVPTPTIVQAVALGPKGAIEGSRIKIFIDVSTTGATVETAVASTLATKGHSNGGRSGEWRHFRG